MPDPRTVKAYGEAMPGLAEAIVKASLDRMDAYTDGIRAETEALRSTTVENERNGKANRWGYLLSITGNIVTPLGFGGGGLWALAHGYDIAGLSSLFIGLAAISPRLITAARQKAAVTPADNGEDADDGA